MISRIEGFLNSHFSRARRFTAAPWVLALLPALLAAGFTFANPGLRREFSVLTEHFARISVGGFFLAGIPSADITWRMPFFDVAFSFFSGLGLAHATIFAGLHLGVLFLVFLAGCLSSGYWAGVLALAGAGIFETLPAGANTEQLFYSFFLLLVMCMLLLKRREDTLRNSIFCGLAIGASILVRSPLFLFPAAAVALEWLDRKRRPFRAGRQFLFLGACYVLLIPWAFLNHSVSGKVEFLESNRAASNVISAAMGSVYTMESDLRKVAGFDRNSSLPAAFLREVGKRPGLYALTTARRLWHIFLFQPLLLGLFIAAALWSRERDLATVFILPAYFIAIHSLLSIDPRYLYPVIYMTPPLIAGTLLRQGGGQPADRGFTRRAVTAAFWLVFAAVMCLEALIIAYPWRAARYAVTSDTFTQASLRFPHDRVFYERHCRELWRDGDDAGFYTCLGAYNRKFGDGMKEYLLSVITSAPPPAFPAPVCDSARNCINGYIAKMLRELQLGDTAAARMSFTKAWTAYQATNNILRAEPYKEDKEFAAHLKRDSSSFFDVYLYDVLLMWPPASMGKMLSGLEAFAALTPRLKELRAEAYEARRRGATGDRELRARLSPSIFSFKPQAGPAGFNPGGKPETQAAAGTAAASAPGTFPHAGVSDAAAFMKLCTAKPVISAKESTLAACQKVIYLAGAGPDAGMRGSITMGLDAAFESYRLLTALHREEEAGETLLWIIKTAPEYWPGRAEAQKAGAEKGME